MEIRDLEYLAASATAGNFARAAASVGISTSTISRRVARLEDQLGLALFERGHSGVRLTPGGRAVMQHVRRVLGELEALKNSGSVSGAGDEGEIRLGVRLPPIGTRFVSLLAGWRARNPKVVLTVAELSDRDLVSGVEGRRLDVVLTAQRSLWPRVASVPLYEERLVAVLPTSHTLARRAAVRWDELREEVVLVQGWDESQSAREFYAAFLGDGVHFRAHPASKQSVFALVSAGFGITFATADQSEAGFAGVVFKRIDDCDASVEMSLAWLPELEDPAVGRFVAFLRDEARLLALPGDNRTAAELREGAVGRHEPLKHRRDQLRRLDGPLSGLPSEHLAVGDEIAMDGRGKLDRQLHRPVVGNDAELELRHPDLLSRDRVRARDRA
jgi:DNA-binding transcriptional LysR family regulator